MKVLVNGDLLSVAGGTAVTALVEQVATTGRGVAVAVNGDVVPRSHWDDTVLADGDRIEILSAAQGG